MKRVTYKGPSAYLVLAGERYNRDVEVEVSDHKADEAEKVSGKHSFKVEGDKPKASEESGD